MNAIIQRIIPVKDEIFNGKSEKDIIPFNAYVNNFQKLHLDSPLFLSSTSYSI